MAELIINEQIAGWSDPNKLLRLAELASEVPENGWIVEVGSFCGRSACAMGMNKRESVLLSCFDKFPDMEESLNTEHFINSMCYGDLANQKYSHGWFLGNVRDVKNIETIRIFTPIHCKYLTFDNKIDLIFIDCIHTYEAVKEDINFWHKHMKPNGVMVFDDYFDMFEGCIKAVDEFVASVKCTTELVSGTAMIVRLL